MRDDTELPGDSGGRHGILFVVEELESCNTVAIVQFTIV